jgi:endonuclease YncB( thermonuclease family)
MVEQLKPLLEESMETKKGITFYVNGNTMMGYVTKIIDNKAIEVKNQRSNKILIAIESIDAVELA